MTSILSDSMAREHAADIQAAASASRRVKEARQARRAARRSARDTGTGHVGHASRTATRPFVAVHDWLAAGQL